MTPLTDDEIEETERLESENIVAGNHMDRSIAAFVRACEAHILEEQAKPLPDNSLIATLCDAVRLTRENTRLAKAPIESAQEANRLRRQVDAMLWALDNIEIQATSGGGITARAIVGIRWKAAQRMAEQALAATAPDEADGNGGHG
jgi:predicted exporter